MHAAALLLFTLTAAGGLDPTERAIRAYVDENAGRAVELVASLAEINSGTLHPKGVRKVGEVLEARLEAIGFRIEWIEMPASMERAGHLFAYREGKKGTARVLLIGHLDTVFEADDPFQKVVREGGMLFGPGVYDMKGGDVVILHALEALHAAGALDDATITVAFIGDEEKVGSPRELARRDLIAAAKKSDVALGFEPGVEKSAVSIARRGSSSWRMKVRARGGHSSGVGGERMGFGAIYEAARFLDATRALFAKRPTLTINPGQIAGGTDAGLNGAATSGRTAGKNNKVAAEAEVAGDLRFLTEAEKEEARSAMRAIAKRALPHAEVELEFADGYPAMPPERRNREVFELLDRVNRDLGYGPMSLVPPEKRGAADISFVAPYVAALAGLGPAGRGAHTREERMDVEHLEVATARAAILLHRLTRAAPSALKGSRRSRTR